MKTLKIIILTSLAWIAIIAGSFWLVASAKPKAMLASQEYQASEYANWVSLPNDAREISVHFYAGRDVNYRTVSFQSGVTNLNEIMDASLKRNIQHHEEPISRLENVRVSLDGLFSVFIYGDDSIPSWWIQNFPGDYKASILFWTHDEYGMGYLVIEDVKLHQVRVLQFSQQWLTFDAIQKAFPQKDE
jgi:hypothetical protein